MRSALLAVKGVTRAKVTLENREAVVTYDQNRATVDDLIEAVKNAKGMNKYSAKLKTAKGPSS